MFDNMPPKLTQNEFVRRCQAKHGDKYVYDRVNYQGVKIKVEIYCVTCDKYFEQRPDGHMTGKGCGKCSKKKSDKYKRIVSCTNEKFIEKAVAVHDGKYGYDRVKYTNAKTNIEILCFKCKKYFFQTPNNHVQGKGCPTCAIKKVNLKNTSDTKNFIVKAIKRHGDKRYNYSKVIYEKNRKNVTIHCNLCNTDFEQSPHTHLTGNGCTRCQSSKGEIYLQNFLNTYGIKYEIQKCFIDCKGFRNVLPFDIWCPDHNILIEHQGNQHTESIPKFGGDLGLAKRQKYDEIKKRYAESTGKTLIYTHYNEKESEKCLKLINIFEIKYELPFKNTFVFRSKKLDDEKKTR